MRLTERKYFSKPKQGGFKKILLTILVVALIGGLGFGLTKLNLFGTPPQISVLQAGQVVQINAPLFVGKNPPLIVKVQSTSGVRTATVTIAQGEKKAVVGQVEQGSSEAILDLATLDPTALSMVEGPATLTMTAISSSLFRRTVTSTYNVTLDLAPPRVEITSAQHYINQGGADVVTYHVSDDTVWSGVVVGDNEFVGYAKPGSATTNGDRFAFFVYSYNLPPNTPIFVEARDAAGNVAKATLVPAKFFPKEFRKRDLPITDEFIDTKVADIISNTPGMTRSGDRLADYLSVNRDLRHKNAEFLKELSRQSAQQFFWNGAFAPLANAAIEASFADTRSYMYNGQKVDEQVHLGFDMAVTEHYPISSAGAGKVILASYFGIYGNTVIVDHGYGLITLYGHLSSIDVTVGQMVTRGQKIGNSGATGLAGGDHLHFSMLIDGVQTNPVEFWDEHWINDHVYLRLGKESFGK